MKREEEMKNSVFILGLIMLIYSCGKDLASAIASNPSNTTTAPWRVTRASVSSDVTNAVKDQSCVSEFGSDYMAGNTIEANGMVRWTVNGTSVNLALCVANYDRSLSSGAIDPVPVFCIHK